MWTLNAHQTDTMISFTILTARLLTLLLLAHSLVANPSLKSWTYSILEIDSNSTNKDQFRIDLKMVRVGRGEYAISGELEFNFKVDESLEVEAQVYRSPDGSAEYKKEPMVIPRQTFFKVMDNFYKTMVMSSVKDCSNLPQYEGNLKELGPELFKFNKCQISTDGFPNNVPEGFYKLYFLGYGPVEFAWYLLVQIEKRNS